MTIEQHKGVHVLRDDLLPGGTKSIFLPKILDPVNYYYVYASPVYGGMQIALAKYAGSVNRQAVIFCAKRTFPHPNTIKCIEGGAMVMQVKGGYLSTCQRKAADFVSMNANSQLVRFGADYPEAIDAIAERMRQVSVSIGQEPDHIYCAVGSGTLLRGIIKGTTAARITGVLVGKELTIQQNDRVSIVHYPKPFEKEANFTAPFPSCPNYDLKAWEVCMGDRKEGMTLFWNVL